MNTIQTSPDPVRLITNHDYRHQYPAPFYFPDERVRESERNSEAKNPFCSKEFLTQFDHNTALDALAGFLDRYESGDPEKRNLASSILLRNGCHAFDVQDPASSVDLEARLGIMVEALDQIAATLTLVDSRGTDVALLATVFSHSSAQDSDFRDALNALMEKHYQRLFESGKLFQIGHPDPRINQLTSDGGTIKRTAPVPLMFLRNLSSYDRSFDEYIGLFPFPILINRGSEGDIDDYFFPSYHMPSYERRKNDPVDQQNRHLLGLQRKRESLAVRLQQIPSHRDEMLDGLRKKYEKELADCREAAEASLADTAHELEVVEQQLRELGAL